VAEYSIFEGTMADMTYVEIEKASINQACVLLPIAVIEGHGPHMCLGVDTYITYALCKKISEKLNETGKQALIAPPFYWGINRANEAFPGSFTVRKTTMTAMLVDILLCIKKWGFKDIFLINIHGDLSHNKAIIEAAQEAWLDHEVGVRAVLAEPLVKACKVTGNEDFVLLQKTLMKGSIDGFIDLHAGAMETAWMFINFPGLVNVDLARELGSSKTTTAGLITWAKGGQGARGVIPLGYCGEPSRFDPDEAYEFERTLVQELAHAITECLDVT